MKTVAATVNIPFDADDLGLVSLAQKCRLDENLRELLERLRSPIVSVCPHSQSEDHPATGVYLP